MHFEDCSCLFHVFPNALYVKVDHNSTKLKQVKSIISFSMITKIYLAIIAIRYYTLTIATSLSVRHHRQPIGDEDEWRRREKYGRIPAHQKLLVEEDKKNE